MTDTIGWGEVDDRPGRLPHSLRLTRRRRIALVVVAALVAGGTVAWPSFRSWRADAAAREVQRIWSQVEGLNNARILTLSGLETTLSNLDRAKFSRAVAEIDTEEAGALDRLASRAKRLRTWTADVASAGSAVVAAISAQIRALRAQAKDRNSIGVDLPLTSTIDGQSSTANDTAATRVDALRARHHLRALAPATEHFHSADAVLTALRRPTDDLLHLRLVSGGIDGLTVTDLDTGRVVVRRSVDASNPESWQPQRLFGPYVVGSVESGDTLLFPVATSGREHVVRDSYVQSSTGSPMWVTSLSTGALHAVDESGRAVTSPVRLPDGVALTGFGTGLVLLATNGAGGVYNGPGLLPRYELFRPATGARTRLATDGCPQLPGFGGGFVVVPTGHLCGEAGALQVFDLSGRLVRTAKLPAGQATTMPPICSPDGRHVALSTASVSTADSGDVVPTTLRLFDARTGSWTTVRESDGWMPIGWSSDGATLLLQLVDNTRFTPGQQFGQLGYLRSADPTTLHSIRIPADLSNYLS